MVERSKFVFVEHLNYRTDWRALKDHFKQVGNVKYADIFTDPHTGRSKGVGLVEFASEQDAARAVQELNNSSLDGRTIEVRLDDGSRKPSSFNRNFRRPQRFGPMMMNPNVTCHRCGQPGHLRAFCPQNETPVLCNRCGQPNHFAKDCLKALGAPGTIPIEPSKIRCRECGKVGHMAAECPDIVCRSCNQTGHISANCPTRARG